MSGHLLSTVNPDADSVNPDDLPPLGARVQYFARPGMGQGAKTTFAADVLHVNPTTGLVSLLIIYGADDAREMINQRRRSDQNPFGWDYMPAPQLTAELASLRKAIFGDYNPPKRSVIDILADFEKRLAAIGGEPAKVSKRK